MRGSRHNQNPTNTETITSIQPTTPTAAEEAAAKIQAKFDDQEKVFSNQETRITKLRAWIAKHREALAPFVWSCYAYDLSVDFTVANWSNPDAKAIARAFGADGWKRVHDDTACGSVNWLKTVDDVKLTIRHAENIKPVLREDVRL